MNLNVAGRRRLFALISLHRLRLAFKLCWIAKKGKIVTSNRNRKFNNNAKTIDHAALLVLLCLRYLPRGPRVTILHFEGVMSNINISPVKNNEKRDNKQCLLNTPRRITVYHKNYFGNKVSSCKCPMDGCTL